MDKLEAARQQLGMRNHASMRLNYLGFALGLLTGIAVGAGTQSEPLGVGFGALMALCWYVPSLVLQYVALNRYQAAIEACRKENS
jgi:hypothetical protein